MGSRLEFQLRLETLAGSGIKVYFQPPANNKISYPCVIYSLSRMEVDHADNQAYFVRKAYEVKYVDKNPDATFPDMYIKSQPMTRFDREFCADNLHHWVFTTYY